jgi:predicted nuclease of predicted toxin-antitoxin system
MPALRLLANMNISSHTVDALRSEGWDVIRVSEILPVNAQDHEILEFARQENRVVITQDLDFSALLALAGFNKPSLISLRMTVSDPEAVTQKLIELLPGLQSKLAEGCAVTIDDSSVRIRLLPIG